MFNFSCYRKKHIFFRCSGRIKAVQTSETVSSTADTIVSEESSSEVQREQVSENGDADRANSQSENRRNAQKRSYKMIVIPSHISVNNGSAGNAYTCNVCGKSFQTKSHVKYHIYCVGGTYFYTIMHDNNTIYLTCKDYDVRYH